jgi:hypothetical protein
MPQVLVVTVAVLLASVSGAAMGPVHAVVRSVPDATRAVGVDRCPIGRLCVWTQPNFAGAMTEFLDDPNWAGQCRLMRTPVRSVANRTGTAPWRLSLFLFRNPRARPACNRHGVYAQYLPGQNDPAVAGGPATGLQIYAEPNSTGG